MMAFRWALRMNNIMTSTAPALKLPHDIILPPAVSWWPPAYGWWILFSVLLVLMIAIVLHYGRRYQRRAPLRLALQQLHQLGTQSDDRLFLSACAHWLKQHAMQLHGREQTASLNGEAWLHFLDQTGATKQFSEGEGRVLLSLYQVEICVQRETLLALMSSWIHQQFNPRAGSSHRV